MVFVILRTVIWCLVLLNVMICVSLFCANTLDLDDGVWVVGLVQ